MRGNTSYHTNGPTIQASLGRGLTLIMRHKKSHLTGLFLYAESEGFEPPDRLGRSTDFESAPFDHSGSSPD